jgi:hypothetical protein
MMGVRIRCKRCAEDFELIPGYGIQVFCETCKRQMGRKIYESEQLGLNRRYAWQRDQESRAPWGNVNKNVGKRILILGAK